MCPFNFHSVIKADKYTNTNTFKKQRSDSF